MVEFVTSLVVIFTAIAIAPYLSAKLRLPLIIVEIIFGIIFGRTLLNIISDEPVFELLKSFGLIYLMFLAGLDIDIESIKENLYRTAFIALASISVPFTMGAAISSHVGMHPLYLGVIFSTTSLGLILPLAKELEYRKDFFHILLGSVILVDILSMFLLAFSITWIHGDFELSFLYSLLLILLLFLIPYFINKMEDFQKRVRAWLCDEAHFEQGVRFSFALIATLVTLSGKLGFHAIIGAFIAGLIISEIMPKEKGLLERKLESFGYGFFIPLFFILVGAKVNLSAILSNVKNLEVLAIILFVGIASKVVGVGTASGVAGFSMRESLSMGFLHSARLSLIIAGVEIGSKLGLIDENLFSIFMILAMVSAILCPSVGKHLLANFDDIR